MFDKTSLWRSLLLAVFAFGALAFAPAPAPANDTPLTRTEYVPRCLPHDAMVAMLDEKFDEKIKDKREVNGSLQELLVGPRTWSIIVGVKGSDSTFCIVKSGRMPQTPGKARVPGRAV